MACGVNKKIYLKSHTVQFIIPVDEMSEALKEKKKKKEERKKRKESQKDDSF